MLESMKAKSVVATCVLLTLTALATIVSGPSPQLERLDAEKLSATRGSGGLVWLCITESQACKPQAGVQAPKLNTPCNNAPPRSICTQTDNQGCVQASGSVDQCHGTTMEDCPATVYTCDAAPGGGSVWNSHIGTCTDQREVCL